MRNLWLMLLIAGLAAVASPAATRPLPLVPGYKLTSFTEEQGAPAATTAFAQTADGLLWIGTSQGLWRFDGLRFERMTALERPSGSGVRSLLFTRAGELWIGYGYGGVGRSRDGRLLSLPATDAPKGWTESLVEAPDGAIWAVSAGTVFRYAGRRWTKRRLQDLGRVDQVLIAGDGVPWACAHAETDVRLLRLDPLSLRATAVLASLHGSCSLALDRSGAVTVADDAGLRVLAPRPRPLVRWPTTLSNTSLAIGRAGDVWAVGLSRRLVRWPAPGRENQPVTFESASDAASFSTGAFEDREGNWWIGTDRGIDRFHPVGVTENSIVDPALVAVVPTEDRPYEVLVDGKRIVYIRIDRHLFRIERGGRAAALPVHAGLSTADGVCGAREGGLWVHRRTRVIELIDGPRRRRVTLPAATITPTMRDCAEDGEGRLWVGTSPFGLLRYDEADAHPTHFVFNRHGTTLPYLLAATGRGVTTYVGYGDLASIDGGTARLLLGFDHNPLTFVGAIQPVGDGLLLAGESGIGLLRRGRLTMLPASSEAAFNDISGIVRTASGETWLRSSAGIVRMSTAALMARLSGRPGPLPLRIFDHDDGVAMRGAIAGFTDAVEAADGRLWFASPTGILSLDPRRLPRNSAPPPITIQAIAADDHFVANAPAVRLAAGTRSLRIDFAVGSLGVPRRVQVRYRLAGIDRDWIDPGDARQAIYAGLGPSRYRFNVIASNDDGVWNRAGAAIDIVIPPTFTQSRWFVVLCAAAALLLGWVAYMLRVRAIRVRFDALLHERLDERGRIARDLHDTLLQALQGLMLRFQAAADQLPSGSPTRDSLDRALDQADAVIVEGRDKVHELRARGDREQLDDRIAEAVRTLAEEGGADVVLDVHGQRYPVRRRVADEIVAIVTEALRNALRHARAQRVEIVLRFDAKRLVIAIRDDGRGFSVDTANQKRAAGHFGLIGMEERARVIGVQLMISSREGAGAEVKLHVPASVT